MAKSPIEIAVSAEVAEALDDIGAGVQRLAAAIRAGSGTSHTKPPPVPDWIGKAIPAPAADELPDENIRSIGASYTDLTSRPGGVYRAMDLLKAFGVSRPRELQPDKYPAFGAALRRAIASLPEPEPRKKRGRK